jgi:hypothetical protein
MSKLKGDLAPKPNKTPYEVRLEILHLAQHIVEDKAEKTMHYLQTQSDIAHSFLHRDYEEEAMRSEEAEALIRSAKANINQMPMPQMGVDEVLSIATKLNDFVSNG